MDIRTIRRSIDTYSEYLGEELSELLIDMYESASELEYVLDWKADENAIEQALNEGKFALAAQEPRIDTKWLVNSIQELIQASGLSLDNYVWDTLYNLELNHALTKPHDTLNILVSHLEIDSMLDKTFLINRFTFAFSLALAVFGEAVHRSLNELVSAINIKPPTHCPICGNPAALAYIEEGSARDGAPKYLWCSTCHYSWRFSRIKCEVCGNLVQNELHYIYKQDDDSHKLHICEKCNSAFPVIDRGKTSVLSALEIEEFIMVDLMQTILSQELDLDGIINSGKAE